jgi:hypothetical protein
VASKKGKANRKFKKTVVDESNIPPTNPSFGLRQAVMPEHDNGDNPITNKNLHDDDNSCSDGDDICTSCSHCLLPICGRRNIRCDMCSSTFHQKCTTIPANVFDKIIAFVGVTGWVCEDCRRAASQSHRRLEAAVAHLAEELTTVKCALNELSASQSQLSIPDIESHSAVCTVTDHKDKTTKTTISEQR